jgi:uncharacterized protein
MIKNRIIAGAMYVLIVVFSVVAAKAANDPPQTTDNIIAAAPKVADALSPSAPGSVKLEGYLGARIDAMIRNSVMAQDIERVVRPFRDKEEIGDGHWRTEYWGKWATSVGLACRYQPTPEHLAVMKKAVDELLATKDPNGYIGTRKPQHHLKGWDVWGRKYVLLGLLADYDLTGNKAILEAAGRHTDTLLAECGPGKANIAAIGYPAWKGLPPSSVLEPVVLLYRRTGEKKYLDFAEYIVGQWSKPNHWSPNGLRLVEDALAGKPPVDIGAPKAYEMMSCYEGLCELYRATGEQKYRDACVKIADNIAKDEMTVIGSGSKEEQWAHSQRLQWDEKKPLQMETCVTVTWMKFCYQLLRLTGDPKYADALETSLYNALLGALTPEGRWWGYNTVLLGERVPSHAQQADVGLSCCVASGPRGMLLAPAWAVMTDADGPVVNLYNRGEYRIRLPSGNTVRIVQDTGYPAEDLIALTIHPETSEAFSLALRIPAWSEQNSLLVNGKMADCELKPGTYARIHRKWSPGDKVQLKLDLRGRIVDAPEGNKFVALARGPLVLALDRRFYSEKPKTSFRVDRTEGSHVALTPNPAQASKHGVWLAFDAAFTANHGEKQTLTLCDFASAGNTWDDRSSYRVWLPQPLDLAKDMSELPRWEQCTPVRPRPKMPKL